MSRGTEHQLSKEEFTVNWYHYIACFFAGMFLANFIPHFVHGISGDAFPTPFAHPPGKGLSSPTVNVLWGLLNLFAGYVLFRVGKLSDGRVLPLLVFFGGITVLSTAMSIRFSTKQLKRRSVTHATR